LCKKRALFSWIIEHCRGSGEHNDLIFRCRIAGYSRGMQDSRRAVLHERTLP
jgi:hypothetical protein